MARMEHGGVFNLTIAGVRAFDPDEPDAAVNPTTLDAKIAVVGHGVTPVDADFKLAIWLSTTKIALKVGIGQTVDPTPGQYDVHAAVIGGTTQPRWKAGMLEVY